MLDEYTHSTLVIHNGDDEPHDYPVRSQDFRGGMVEAFSLLGC